MKPQDWTEDNWRSLVNTVRAGRSLTPATWPGGARCALALSFDCDHETFEMGGGGRAIGRLGWGEFGRRVGVPRILKVLANHDAKATFFIPAVSALIDPEEPGRIADLGHEIGIHGWIHENTSLLEPDAERDLIRRSRDTLERLSGQRPVGHRASHWDLSPHTIEIVADEGFLYDSSMMADDSPYELLCHGRATGLVEIPVDWVRDDAVYLLFNRNPPTRPTHSPQEVLDVFKAEFDAAFDDGGICQLVLHPFVIGNRSRIWILDALIAHARARGAVWIASHADIAEHCKTP